MVTQALVTNQSYQQVKLLTFAISLGLLGALVNSFLYPFLPEVDLVFGNVAFVLVAMRLFAPYALLATVIAVTPLYFAWDSAFVYLIFGFEAFFIAVMRKRGWYILFADLAYWAVLGIPLSIVVMWIISEPFSTYHLFLAFKQAINGALYTCLACFLMFILDRRGIFAWQQQPRVSRPLKSQVVYVLVLISTLAVIITSLFISRNFIHSSQGFIDKTLNNNAKSIAHVTKQYISEHETEIAHLSQWLSMTSPDNWQKILNLTSQQYSGFLTMLIADKEGFLTNTSPEYLLDKVTSTSVEEQYSVRDRQYFQQAIAGTPLYISDVFQGRGFGHDPIIAISAPIRSIADEQEVIAIVEGSLDLNLISKVTMSAFEKEEISVVVVDQNNKVIFSSPELNLPILSGFDYSDLSSSVSGARLSIKGRMGSYAFGNVALENNWQVFALVDYQVILHEIEYEYLVIFIILFITIVSTALIANRVGSRLSRPLNFIIKQVRRYDDESTSTFKPLYFDAGTEVEQLYQEITTAKHEIIEHQRELERKVLERTQALDNANKQLQALALVDGLTKVNNRRYLDENFVVLQKSGQRNNACIAVAMVDLDFFKKLNDQYGHLAGDQCLVQTAQLIKQAFDRDTDIVARFGGEEFVVVAPYISYQFLEQKLEQLRKDISAQLFTDENQQNFSVSASLGAVIAQADYADDIKQWIELADKCLYQAKHTGRNKVIINNLT